MPSIITWLATESSYVLEEMISHLGTVLRSLGKLILRADVLTKRQETLDAKEYREIRKRRVSRSQQYIKAFQCTLRLETSETRHRARRRGMIKPGHLCVPLNENRLFSPSFACFGAEVVHATILLTRKHHACSPLHPGLLFANLFLKNTLEGLASLFL